MTKNFLIIGGNSDIGLEINNLAKAEGYSVYGTSRDEATSTVAADPRVDVMILLTGILTGESKEALQE